MIEHEPIESEEHSGAVDYERSDAKPWFLGILLTVCVLLIGLMLVGLNEAFILSREKMYSDVALKPESEVLRDVKAHAEQLLTTYGVVDSAKGIYRIPIERAMKLAEDEAYAQSQTVAGKK